ncbi:hypothetical protein PVK64_02015 [Aliivibrio sp. S4TY2]|uniref:hypothetical protein n=1 Tax=unclassified Aliivibrio TaxID=2645654 RepID=UPI0023798E86|nr:MULTISPECIES: hypothetical protein [unclassified Aliivibrio]MDD9154968.1 hypothetical protein [Aliivibrio sp. S4TY2]MDD9158669.1 hypothetical protein [Aliivibrio sp. S4TY1]MDD9162971.1 hypothetical protein [Aliivibrio sp. S4MY2]MDD9166668.1 hypothetical protein [Aliivibrio sp. S4MY4]MDD9184048.1 hypothetical protein [Aliivibrio sp. S4MY3]
MNHSLSKLFCTSVLISCAITSAYLTYLYMNELGAAIGVAVIFSLIGITLDLVKTITPTFIPTVAKQNPLIAVLLVSLTGVLIVISTIASISAIEKGADNMAVSTKQNLAITEQIKLKQQQLANLQQLSDEQLRINYATPAAATAVMISSVTDDLNALYEAQSSVKSTSMLREYDATITLIIAVTIEVVSVVMALTLHSLNTLEVSVKSVSNPVNTRVEPPSEKQVIQSVMPSVEVYKTPEMQFAASVMDDVKEAILSGAVKPSQRALKAAFNLQQEQIKIILNALHEQDVLEPWNNGGFRVKA